MKLILQPILQCEKNAGGLECGYIGDREKKNAFWPASPKFVVSCGQPVPCLPCGPKCGWNVKLCSLKAGLQKSLGARYWWGRGGRSPPLSIREIPIQYSSLFCEFARWSALSQLPTDRLLPSPNTFPTPSQMELNTVDLTQKNPIYGGVK